MKKIQDIKAFFSIPGIAGRSLDKNSQSELVHLTLDPKTILEQHKTPFDSKFVVFRGNGIIVVDGKETNCEQGMIFDCKGSIPHGLKNDSTEIFEVLVIKDLSSIDVNASIDKTKETK